MNFPLFIAKRIYNDPGDKQKVSRPAIRIATIGVAIGLAVMIVSVSVVLGFKHTIRDKAIGFGSHITVAEFSTINGIHQYPVCMDDSMVNLLRKINGVKHVQRFAMSQGILKTDNDFLGVMVKGVDEQFDTTFVHQYLVEGTIPTFSGTSSKQQIIISKLMADKLQLHAGQSVYAYFINNNVRARKFTIAGIYQTNLKKYDEVICFTDLYTAVKINGWEPDQATGAELTVNDFEKIDQTEETIIALVNRTKDKYHSPYSSATVQESNPQIFSWLNLLDLNVWIILVLMICVAGFTMISGLLIIILERTNMIGVLKALGSRNKAIRHTFLWFAVFIIGKGMLWGNILGIGITLLQKVTGLIKLDAATYYVDTVPVEINLPMLVLINVCTLIVSVFVLIAPSYLISHIHPAKSMRYE